MKANNQSKPMETLTKMPNKSKTNQGNRKERRKSFLDSQRTTKGGSGWQMGWKWWTTRKFFSKRFYNSRPLDYWECCRTGIWEYRRAGGLR